MSSAQPSGPPGPVDPVELLRRGREQLQAGDAAGAVHSLRRAALLAPRYVAVHAALGAAYARLSRFEEAVQSHQQAVLLAPHSPEAWSDLASTFLAFGRAEAAVPGYRMALRLAPDAAVLHHNLGTALARTGDLAGATDSLRRAAALQPRQVGTLVNLGAVLRRQGLAGEAIAVLRRALEVSPDDPDAWWNLALALLGTGATAEGWAAYEWRRRVAGAATPAPGAPGWDGAPLPGGTLLLRTEQGLGDTIQFLRYAAAARERVGRLIVQSPAALVALLAGCDGVDGVVARDAPPPPHDRRAPLLSLPHLLGQPRPTAGGPYLHADPARVARWRERLAPLGGRRVVIGWQGNPGYEDDRHRSIPLAAFEPLARRPGVHLVAVQKDPGRDQLARWPADLPLVDLAPELDSDGAFVDTAAVVTAADLVVTSDTALAHLAGALGAPVWLVLAHAADWRWGLGGGGPADPTTGEGYPWYGSMRLFRQPRPGDWPGAFAAVAAALEGGP